LVIEVDGSVHDIEDVKLHDIGRDVEFEKFGITTIRFKNEEVIENINGVIEKIKLFSENKLRSL
jgi:cyclase